MHTRDLPFLFITGGCRSGKSAWAQRFAEKISPHRLYLATAVLHDPTDQEMQERVRLHQEARGQGWRTHEAGFDEKNMLADALHDICRPGESLLFDCLTLWCAGRMQGDEAPPDFAAACDSLLRALWELPCPVIIVSNELGMGITPASAAGRNFRDMAGLANQKAAAKATAALLMVSGIPLLLKGELPPELGAVLSISGATAPPLAWGE